MSWWLHSDFFPADGVCPSSLGLGSELPIVVNRPSYIRLGKDEGQLGELAAPSRDDGSPLICSLPSAGRGAGTGGAVQMPAPVFPRVSHLRQGPCQASRRL